MDATNKLLSKLKSSGNIGAIIGVVLLVVTVFVGLAMLGGLLLVWGLNLMGIDIAYSLKSIIGGAIIVVCLKPTGFKSKEK